MFPSVLTTPQHPLSCVQAVMSASSKRFTIDRQSDPVEFLSWLANTLHHDLTGGKRKKRSGELPLWWWVGLGREWAPIRQRCAMCMVGRTTTSQASCWEVAGWEGGTDVAGLVTPTPLPAPAMCWRQPLPLRPRLAPSAASTYNTSCAVLLSSLLQPLPTACRGSWRTTLSGLPSLALLPSLSPLCAYPALPSSPLQSSPTACKESWR